MRLGLVLGAAAFVGGGIFALLAGSASSASAAPAIGDTFQFSVPSSVNAGTQFSFTVTAYAGGAVDPTYAGTVEFTSNDPLAHLPSPMTLSSGTGTFDATLYTAGSQTITGTDETNPDVIGTSTGITVDPIAATHFVLSAPSAIFAGTQFNFTVTAEDEYNNLATGYGGSVNFTSSDDSATLPANGSTLTNGTATFPATLNALGGQSITATDSVTSSITGSIGITVTPSTITVGSSPQGIATDPSSGDVYVANAGSDTLSVIDGITNQLSQTVFLGCSPVGVVVDPANSEVLVATDGNGNCDAVLAVSESNDAVVASLSLGGCPEGLTLAPNGDVYVANGCNSAVDVINPASNTVIGSPITGVCVNFGIAAAANGDIYSAGCNEVTVISTTNNTVSGSPISIGNCNEGAAVDAANGDLYVANDCNNSVSVISTATNTVLTTVGVGCSPVGVGVDPANGDVYVADQGCSGNQVSVISGSTNTNIATANVGSSPWGVAADSVNGDVYVTNSGTTTVSVLVPPTVSGVTPDNGPGQGGSVVHISGNFLGNGSVYFGTAKATSYLCASETSCTATAPNGSGTIDVTVVTTQGSSPTNVNDQFSFLPTPNAPGSPSATAGDETVALSWTTPSAYTGPPVEGYEVYEGTSSGQESVTPVYTSPLNDTAINYTVTGLTDGTKYYFVIAAYNAVGTGPISGEVSARPQSSPSTTSASVSVDSVVYGNPVTFTGTAAPTSGSGPFPTGTVTFSVGTTSLCTTGRVSPASGVSATASCQASEFPAGNDTVTATYSGDGYYSGSTGTTTLTVTGIVPSAPGDLVASPGSSQVTIAWTVPASNGGSPVESYEIWRSTTSNEETQVDTVNSGSATSYTDTDVTPGTAYYYEVVAVNSAGPSILSGEASATPYTHSDAPGGLTATAGSSQISLSWSDPTDSAEMGYSTVTGYEILRATSTGGETTYVPLNDGSSISYTDTDVTPGTTYYYEVEAVNAAGDSVASGEASATPYTYSDAPSSLTASAGTSQVTLSWIDPSSNGFSTISGYDILRSTISGQELEVSSVSGATTTSYDDTNLTPGTQYYYEVLAVNAAGNSNVSTEASATPYTYAAQPTGLTATAGSSQVSLTWTDPTSGGFSMISGYEILRSTSSTQAPADFVFVNGGAATTYTDLNVTLGTTYYYEVVAVNASGDSGVSNEQSATPYTYSDAPSGVTASPGSSQVTLSWADPTDTGFSTVSGYEILRSTLTGQETVLTSVDNGTAASYTDTDLSPGTTYYYEVEAINSAGDSGVSNEASATPFTMPAAPSGISATAGDATASVAFTAPSTGGSPITNYTVIATDLTNGADGGQAATGTSSPIVVKSLVNGDTYTFAVMATNAAGTGLLSSPSNAVTPTGVDTLTITISGAQTYGSSTPTLTYGETPAGVTTAGTLVCSKVEGGSTIGATLGAGSYTIDASTCSGLSATGYGLSYQAAANGFVDSPAPLTIAASSATVSYGQTPPDVTASYYGFVNGDTSSSLTHGPTCSTKGTASSPPGSYANTCSGAADPNYSTVYVPGTLTVTPATISIKVAGSQNYGSSSTTFSYSISPSLSGVTGSPTCTEVFADGTPTSISAVLGAGSYDIDTASCSGLSAPSQDYSLAFAATGDVLKVAQVPLTISASSATMSYGSNVPTVTASYSGFVNNDAAAALAAPPICSTTATSSSTVGTYDSTCSGAVDANYDISYVGGTVTVRADVPQPPRALAATAGDHQVVLRWQAPSNDGGTAITNYETFEGTAPGAEGATPIASTTATSATITGLTNGTPYYFTVQAVNEKGNSISSGEASATPGGGPAVATGVTVSLARTATPGAGELEVSWNSPAPGSPHVSAYAIVPSPACAACTGLRTTATSSLVGGLVAGTNYRFTVVASNSFGNALPSKPSRLIDVTSVPGAPTSVTAQVLLSGSAVVRFVPSTIETGLDVTSFEVAPVPACPGCGGTTVSGTARSATIIGLSHDLTYRFAVYAINADGPSQRSLLSAKYVDKVAIGYFLGASDGEVFGLGAAHSYGGVTASSSDPLAGVAGTSDGLGYLVVTREGVITAFGDAKSYGDLSGRGITDIVSIVTTSDGAGYWIVGANGGIYPFGDATSHGDLPAMGVHVSDVVGMVATPGGAGYQLIGSDGGVFSFGTTRFYGSLPGIHAHVHDIVGIVPSATNTGYVLVGADGGAFVFGSDTPYLGSLPARDVKVHDIVGLAVTADGQGYYMAGADGSVYGFGDARAFTAPAMLAHNLPITAISDV
jgi:YVTN family beta-propeller protein